MGRLTNFLKYYSFTEETEGSSTCIYKICTCSEIHQCLSVKKQSEVHMLQVSKSISNKYLPN